MGKFILHCDMNNFYASVECIGAPRLLDVPMAVCGDPATRHGIILAKNSRAKRLGIITGESVREAQKKVPTLTLVYADYTKYTKYGLLARKLYSEYTEQVTPYGLDEAWLDLTGHVTNFEQAKQTADKIRERVKKELHLTASVGVSYNYIFAKLASDMKKPDATTVLRRADLKSLIWQKPAFEMLFVGPATCSKLRKMGILTIGDIAQACPSFLQQSLGKCGIALWKYANGDDTAFDPRVPEDDPFKSFGNSITLPRDITDRDDMLSVLRLITHAVVGRLHRHSLKTQCVSVYFKHKDFSSVTRQSTLFEETDSESKIFFAVQELFCRHYEGKLPVRSLGVRVAALTDARCYQMTFFDEPIEKTEDLSALSGMLERKIGALHLEPSVLGTTNVSL